MTEVGNSRSQFGSLLRGLRKGAGLTLRELEGLTGIVYSQISSIKRGEKALGADSALKLADVFGLGGQERDDFLLKAAATRKRDKLVVPNDPKNKLFKSKLRRS